MRLPRAVTAGLLAVTAAATCAACTTSGTPATPTSLTCSYPTGTDAAARPAQKPSTADVSRTGTVAALVHTSAGEIPLTLDRDRAPCTVHSFVSLTEQTYFVDTPCHRLTAPPAAVFVLQCGDPTGTGAGGPGYVVPDELPLGLAPAAGGGSAGGDSTVVYPRGTVALANRAVPDSGGSQFFLVYRDTVLPRTYTVFGRVDPPGLPVLDRIAAGGEDDSNGPGDGRPRIPVQIRAIDIGRT
ncbi:peptidylprolyl isomerase [Speluncibacter jeojiensis]|uniref:Peptidylprolyl isomerase n=1 Tax=Speluncibacter jeojiensis TaxID=2710754 RepID=A0A9X4M4F7_9ACTN|nr:peptidylprolyl isomerase [Corynebacteriales bacterium D3-21]